MGSVVGGLYAAGLPVDSIEHKFVSLQLMKAFVTVPIHVRMVTTPIFQLPRFVGIKEYDGMYRGKHFAEFLDNSVPPSARNLEDLRIPFGAVALNLLDGQVYTLRKGDLGQAIQASSAIPVLKKPVELGGKLFVDGGVTTNLPVAQVREIGAKIVIAVDVDERFEPEEVDSFKQNGSVVHRVMTLHLSSVDEKQLKAADIIIHPQVNGIGMISMQKSDVRDAIAAGEKAAREAMPEIKRKLEAAGIILPLKTADLHNPHSVEANAAE